MKLELTQKEIEVLKFYLGQALIDAKGMAAIGVGSEATVKNLISIKEKLNKI